MFGQLRRYAAAEALATRIAVGPVYGALAELLLAAPGCAFIPLGLLVQLTFSSDAAARLTAVSATSKLQGGDNLGGVLCGMFRVLRSLPHAAAVALLQSVVNIGRGPCGVAWLQEAGFTLAVVVRLASGFTGPTTRPPWRDTANPHAELHYASGDRPCAVEPGKADVKGPAEVLRPLRAVPGGGGAVACGATDAAGGGGGGAVGDAGATAGALRLEGLLRQVVSLLLDSAYGWKATQQQPELEAQAKHVLEQCTD